MFPLQEAFHGAGALVWADATNGTQVSPTDIMARVTRGFSSGQLGAVKKASSAEQLPFECPQNFNGFSECYAAVIFHDIPANTTSPANYTILADSGLFHIDVVRHKGDFESRVFPLQWAIDQAIIELKTGVTVSAPLQWPFTNETNEGQDKRIRLGMLLSYGCKLVSHQFRLHPCNPGAAGYRLVSRDASLFCTTP